MTDREGLFSKGRNSNSSQPVARPLPLNTVSARQGRGLFIGTSSYGAVA
ncbi:MAG: hypothetical protein V1689_12600 [Pseudomonadota bacterium]